MFQQELALTQNPQLRSEALMGVGTIYEEQKKDKEALEVFQQVATLMPSRPEPYLEMAAIHTRLGEPEKAKAILEQAQKMGASSPEGLLNIGISYFNKKEYEKGGGHVPPSPRDAFRQRERSGDGARAGREASPP